MNRIPDQFHPGRFGLVIQIEDPAWGWGSMRMTARWKLCSSSWGSKPSTRNRKILRV